jgi:hypothetical protein
VELGALSHALFAGEYGTLLPNEATSKPVRRTGVPPFVLVQVSAPSVVNLNVASAFMYTSVVEDAPVARYALKQLLGTFASIVVPALSVPELLAIGTSTILLNHCAFELLHVHSNLLASAALFVESPTSTFTEFDDFCTVSEKVKSTEKSLTGTTVVCGYLPDKLSAVPATAGA